VAVGAHHNRAVLDLDLDALLAGLRRHEVRSIVENMPFRLQAFPSLIYGPRVDFER
jgi:hypothetical protein